jgi:hypothetical protein
MTYSSTTTLGLIKYHAMNTYAVLKQAQRHEHV